MYLCILKEIALSHDIAIFLCLTHNKINVIIYVSKYFMKRKITDAVNVTLSCASYIQNMVNIEVTDKNGVPIEGVQLKLMDSNGICRAKFIGNTDSGYSMNDSSIKIVPYDDKETLIKTDIDILKEAIPEGHNIVHIERDQHIASNYPIYLTDGETEDFTDIPAKYKAPGEIKANIVNINGIQTIEINLERSYTLGDVNENGQIDINDATLPLRAYALETAKLDSELTPTQKLAADVNEDGIIDMSDATKILKYYAYTLAAIEVEPDTIFNQ